LANFVFDKSNEYLKLYLKVQQYLKCYTK